MLQLEPWPGPLRFVPCDWDAVLAFARSDPAARRVLGSVLATGRSLPKKPITRRVYRLDDIPEKDRDKRGNTRDENAEPFCLAKHDLLETTRVQNRLPYLALTVRATSDPSCLDCLVEQLREMTTWHPMQRPGWSLRELGKTMPPSGDGNWLATGHGMWCIVETLAMVGDHLPPELVADLKELVRKEMDGILDDWQTKRPWFMKGEGSPESNQWAAPFSALVYGALCLEDEQYRDAYELGVRSLVRTAQAMGVDGSCPEGPEYAGRTTEALFRAAWAAARAGDRRLAEQPFVARFNDWYLHMFMPGGYMVNAYDSRRYKSGSSAPLPFVLASLLATDAESAWVAGHLFEHWPKNALGLAFAHHMSSGGASPTAPVPYGFFPAGQTLTWRSGWDQDTAMGLWVRGASKSDGHAHRDTGHLSLYNGPDLILIDCARGRYDSPLTVPGGAREAGGHNVLQVDALPLKAHCEAPIAVSRLERDGGDITVDATAAYENLRSWKRRIVWSSDGQVDVHDAVAFDGAPRPQRTECFRYHLGSETPVSISGAATEWAATWDSVLVSFSCDVPIIVEQTQMPDFAGPKEHACLRIYSAGPLQGMLLQTRFALPHKR